MTEHSFTFTPDRRPAIHPSGMAVYLHTGLTRVTCICGSRFTISSQQEPQRIFPYLVQRACT